MKPEEVVERIVGFSRPGQSNGLKDFLKTFGEKNLPIEKRLAVAGLQGMDMAQSSICFMYLLDAVVNEDAIDETFINTACKFLHVCTTEVRRFPKRFNRLCARFQSQTQRSNQPKRAINPLISAISKLTNSSQTITPIHPLLFQSCLLAECFSAALPCLTPEPFEIDPPKTGLIMRDFLLFCYYGALIHIGRKQYAAALDLLLQAITAPSLVVSAITMAAYKKYVLVSLIHKGSVPELPRFTPQSVNKGTRAQCYPYIVLAAEFKTKSDEFKSPSNAHRREIVKDGNEALLDLALESCTKREIQRMTETYMTMPVKQIAKAIQRTPIETEYILLRMIEGGDLQAHIDDSTGLIHFKEDMSDLQLSTMAERIDYQLQTVASLANRVKDMDHQVSCEKAYVSKLEPHKNP